MKVKPETCFGGLYIWLTKDFCGDKLRADVSWPDYISTLTIITPVAAGLCLAGVAAIGLAWLMLNFCLIIGGFGYQPWSTWSKNELAGNHTRFPGLRLGKYSVRPWMVLLPAEIPCLFWRMWQVDPAMASLIIFLSVVIIGYLLAIIVSNHNLWSRLIIWTKTP